MSIFGAARAEAERPPTRPTLFTFYASWEKEENPHRHQRRFPPPEEDGFEDACGAAIDGAGVIYVSDYHHDAVDVFERSIFGQLEYVTQIAAEDPDNGPCELAVDAAGNLYVNNWRHDVVKYHPSVYPPTESTHYTGTVIDAGRSTGVALGPTDGRVYVDDRTYVAVYEPSGEPVESEGTPLRIGLGTLASGYGVAVSGYGSTTGRVYVADAGDGTVKAYDPTVDATQPAETIDGAGSPLGGFASLEDATVAVDPTNGNVVVANGLGAPFEHPAAAVDEFSSAGSYRGQPVEGVQFAKPSALFFDESGGLYVTSGNTEFSKLLGLGPASSGDTLQVSETGNGAGLISSTPAGIACGGACSAEFADGEAVSLSAVPAQHSQLVGWKVDGDPSTCPGTGECRLSLAGNTSVTAEFAAIPQQTLTVAASGPGEVTSSPGALACRAASCSEGFDETGPGSVVTLIAGFDPHSQLTHWGGCEAEPSPTECVVTTASARSVTAEFAAIPQQTLTVAASGPGEVTSSPGALACRAASCSEGFDETGPGSVVTLTARSDPHSQLTHWGGCEAGPSPTECVVTTASARSVTAEFSARLRKLTTTIEGPGTGEVVSAPAGIDCGATCSGSFQEGTAVTLTALPAAGSTFAGWSGGGCAVAGTCVVTLGFDASVIARFAQAPIATSAIPGQLLLGPFKAKRDRGVGELKATVSSAGALTATGKGLQGSAASAAVAESILLHLALTRAGRRALARSASHRLQVAVTVTFTPQQGGAPVISRRKVTFIGGRERQEAVRSRARRAAESTARTERL